MTCAWSRHGRGSRWPSSTSRSATWVPRSTGFTALVDLLDDLGVGDPDLWPGPELVEALLQAGERDRAVGVDAAFRERAVRKGQPWSLARAARGRALLAGDDDLDERFGEALRLHAAGPDTFERARTLMAYGARLRRARRRVDARVPLEEARAAFDALGARRWSDVVAAELEATGLRARARTSGPVLGLTPRELQIAQLLAEGEDDARGGGRPVPQPQDGRVPPPARLHEARHLVARRAGAASPGGRRVARGPSGRLTAGSAGTGRLPQNRPRASFFHVAASVVPVGAVLTRAW